MLEATKKPARATRPSRRRHRARTLELTPAGAELAAAMDERLARVVSDLFVDWSPADLADATARIRSVADALTRTTEGDPTR
ncbi:hypothetical protein [Isoptericola variabilis]|uniref:hypothetical protein n=1 Tax=Isoptericola variabilis TaxID=139208 RepID=UPI00117DD701|nr:hypothetical protein [Isoptericola variabilis]